MDFYTGIVFGLFLAWYARRMNAPATFAAAYRTVSAKAQALLVKRAGPTPPANRDNNARQGQSGATAASDAGSDTTLATADPTSLSAKITALQAIFAPLAMNAAHPNETADHPKFQEAVALLRAEKNPLDTVLQYALGMNWALSSIGLAALEHRADRAQAETRVMDAFHTFSAWPMHFALKYLFSLSPACAPGAPLLKITSDWQENAVMPAVMRDHFVRCQARGDAPALGLPAEAISPETSTQIIAFLGRVHHGWSQIFIQQLTAARERRIDRDYLCSIGRFWTMLDSEILVAPDAWREALAGSEAAARQSPARSLLVSGDAGVGKTSFLRLTAARMAIDGWSVFEAGAPELMSGQQWFGQLEGRITKTVGELTAAKKVIWYIPDILQIALSGTHQGQAASILDQILPSVAGGRLILWTECSPSALSRLMRLRPALRSLFEVMRLEPMSPGDTLELGTTLVARLALTSGPVVDGGCVGLAISSARQYLSGAGMPGAALDLLKLTIARAMNDGAHAVEPARVILTLSQLTGLPTSILDNKERVDLGEIRDHFGSRVIGQPEAVATIVDRIAMLKAGLNDPAKPIGVFLFAGPTGTGKTELAKTLAAYLFGSVERMIRLDMSELQTADSSWKILGSGDHTSQSDSLINKVRKQPFSVVLLDEFEKAHASIWDLFLQVFDDGRLTDTLGHTADFRHCIIILTTNLGATSHRTGGIGFAPAQGAYGSEQVMRAIGQTFRPEFQNRLDKVIVFQPLTRELMADILKKELGQVLGRRGFKDREWAVEWEASALEFLLERGFSPEMGARPLKRAIDQYVVAPLAATIVEKRFPQGDQFVFFRSDGHTITAEFVDPDADLDDSVPVVNGSGGAYGAINGDAQPMSLPVIILGPQGTGDELAALEAAFARAESRLDSADWSQRQQALSMAMLANDFWSSPARFETLSQIALMDRVKTAMTTTRSMRGRLTKGMERAGKSSRELIGRLALQLHLLEDGIADVFKAAPIEVALVVEPAFSRAGAEDPLLTKEWCADLVAMYRAWCQRRHMQLSEARLNDGTHTLALVIAGFGASRTLKGECGLHILDMDDDDGAGRAIARVRVVDAPLGDVAGQKLSAQLTASFAKSTLTKNVVRRYRREPSPLVRDLERGWRTGKLDTVLRGDFDLIGAGEG